MSCNFHLGVHCGPSGLRLPCFSQPLEGGADSDGDHALNRAIADWGASTGGSISRSRRPVGRKQPLEATPRRKDRSQDLRARSGRLAGHGESERALLITLGPKKFSRHRAAIRVSWPFSCKRRTRICQRGDCTGLNETLNMSVKRRSLFGSR